MEIQSKPLRFSYTNVDNYNNENNNQMKYTILFKVLCSSSCRCQCCPILLYANHCVSVCFVSVVLLSIQYFGREIVPSARESERARDLCLRFGFSECCHLAPHQNIEAYFSTMRINHKPILFKSLEFIYAFGLVLPSSARFADVNANLYENMQFFSTYFKPCFA